MIIGVMSDTHGNRALMHQVADEMVHRFGAELIFHLGDDYADAEELAFAGHHVRKVPGLWCAAYQNGRIKKRLLDALDGVSVACAHAEKDLRHTERAAALILTGHTHHAEIALLGRSLYVNPGHLKSLTSRGEPASYATIVIDADAVVAAVREVSGAVRAELQVARADLA